MQTASHRARMGYQRTGLSSAFRLDNLSESISYSTCKAAKCQNSFSSHNNPIVVGVKGSEVNIYSASATIFMILGLSQPGGGTDRQPMTREKHNLIVNSFRQEKQLTRNRSGHILTNTGVWSPDGEWIGYDTRSDAAGAVFDRSRIEMLNIQTLQMERLYANRTRVQCVAS